jgi:hypothetical protein
LRQLSTRRFYDPLDAGEERVVAEQPVCADELPARPHDVAGLGPVARGGKMAEATRAVVGEAFQRVRSGGVLLPFEMALGPPDRAAAASVRWRPLLLGTRLFRHGDGRA